jgi:hypothetical protein
MSETNNFHQASETSSLRSWIWAFALSLAAGVAIVLPFFWLGTASGHDFEFHAASWMDVASQWSQGVWYPRWTALTNYGFGEPRFIFYPPFSWMLGAGLGFVLPWVQVPAAFIVLVQTIAGLSAFALVGRLVPERWAIFGAVCYAANPDALVMIYVRSDYAELLACAFFPPLALGALQICGLLESHRSKGREIVFCGGWFAAIWLSNAPAGVIASYSMALLFAWAGVTQKRWQPMVRGGAGMALGLGFAGFYIVPAAFEQRWVHITQALSFGLIPSQNFLFTQINDAEHNTFNLIASWFAVLLMVMTALAALAGWRGSADGRERTSAKKWRAAWLVLFLAASLLMWRVSGVFWEYLPKLRFVQFPWRWMSIVALVMVCFVASAAAKRLGWLWMAVMLALSIGCANYLVHHTWWDPDDIPTLREAVAQGDGFEGTDEYDPQGDDRSNLPRNAPYVQVLMSAGERRAGIEARIRVDRWTTDEKELRITSQDAVRLALRVLNYPAWRVSVNGKVVEPERAEDYDQMIVAVPGGSSEIRVTLARTGDRIVGMMLTCLSLLVGAALEFMRTAAGGEN